MSRPNFRSGSRIESIFIIRAYREGRMHSFIRNDCFDIIAVSFCHCNFISLYILRPVYHQSVLLVCYPLYVFIFAPRQQGDVISILYIGFKYVRLPFYNACEVDCLVVIHYNDIVYNALRRSYLDYISPLFRYCKQIEFVGKYNQLTIVAYGKLVCFVPYILFS